MKNLGGRYFAWVCLFLVGASLGRAADEWRTWKSTAGTAIEAKLTSREGEEITLEKRDGKQVILTLTQLSVEDKYYLLKLNPKDPGSPAIGKTAIPGISAQPGLAQKITCQADPKWSYLLRLPKDFHTGKSWPVCFVMDSAGGTQETINRYAPAAERLGIILVVSSESKNGFADSDLPMKAMAEDVYARIPVLEKVAMASGMSGGSRMAYMLSEINKNVVGVLACASGHGIYLKEKTFRASKLRSDTAICSLIGTNDFNRREAVKSHKTIDRNARIIWFPGNHDWAGPELIDDGLAEVYGRILERSKVQSIDTLRIDFSRKQLDWAKKQAASAPGLTYYWANFLTKFPGDASVNRDAAALLASVPKGPELAKAEKAIKDFANKHFEDGLTQVDKEPVPSRLKEAEKIATTLAGLPQADLIRRMGGPAN